MKLSSFFQLIAEKTVHALESGIKVIFCIGEKLEEREAGQTKDVCSAQLVIILQANSFNSRSTSVSFKLSSTKELAGTTSSLPTSPSGLSELERPLLRNRLRKFTNGFVRSSRRRSLQRSAT